MFYLEVRFWGGEQSAAILVWRPNYLRMFKYFLGIISLASETTAI